MKNPKKLSLLRVYGKILDVIVDIRKQSKNYLKYCSVILSKENNYVLYILDLLMDFNQ